MSDANLGVGEALARIISGCCVLTTPLGDAMLVSFVQQAGFDPPRISVAVRKGRSIEQQLVHPSTFVLNVCADADRTLLKRFAGKRPDDGDWFVGLKIDRTPSGVVLCDAAAHLNCVVANRWDAGDHWMVLADVLAGSAIDGRSPYVHIRRSGMNY